jgi:hypothetical protein
VDRAWAAEQLKNFRAHIDVLRLLEAREGEDYDDLVTSYGTDHDVVDWLVAHDQVMRELIEAALPGLGEYTLPPSGGWSYGDSQYWHEVVRHRVLRAIGIHDLGAEVRERMRPDSPDLVADQFHPWVWDAAAPLWEAGTTQEAIHAAARSVNAHLEHKLGRRDRPESALCREAFSPDEPKSGQPRLRFPGDRTSDTWRSRQKGGMDLGAGLEGIRNPGRPRGRAEPSRADGARCREKITRGSA